MKRMRLMICIVLTVCFVCGFAACNGKSEEDRTTAVDTETTVPSEVETTEPEATLAEEDMASGRYILESEEDGYSLTLNAGDRMPVRVTPCSKDGAPSLTVETAKSGFGVQIWVKLPQPTADFDAQKTQALENGGSEVRIGHYSGFIGSPTDSAVLSLAALPGGDTVFTLQMTSLSAGMEITDVLSDAGIAAFLATMEFNVNV